MNEIPWRPWNEAAFTEAQAQNKPVFLSITAAWCHWCRVMDEQTYANEAIAQYVREHFIPVRVDSDKRPDVNARYTMGGWPTTCVLSPEGDLIWGHTFVPPDGMAQILPQVLNAFHNDKPGMAQHIAQQREQIKQQTTPPPLDPTLHVTPEITRAALAGVKQNFDFANGGFGREQKFPHTEAVELVLEQYARSLAAGAPDPDLKTILDKTITAMAEGGLRDKDGGGFFRYTQTPDWRDPHLEKLLEDNALIARTFARAYQLLGSEQASEVAGETLRYLDAVLYDMERGVWGGSQAADEEYYAQPAAERAEWNPPAADRTVLCGPNALAVRAHVAWWQATGNAYSLAKARRAMDFLLARLRSADGAFVHFLSDDEAVAQAAGPAPSGLLSDSADVTAACLDLYEAGQGAVYLDHAEALADWVRGHLEDPRGGGLFDAVVRPEAVGNLKLGTKDIADNMQMADALLRLFLATGAEEHAQLAQRILQAFIPATGQLGFFGAGFALAAERALLPPILVHVVGAANDPRTEALVEAAHRPYRFERFVQPLDPANPDDAEHLESLEYPASEEPAAYVCVAAACLPPTRDPAVLTETVRTASG
jgi:hypothetical protein